MKLIVLGLAVAVFSSSAAVYKWVDSNGTLIFGDMPPDGVQAVKIASYGDDLEGAALSEANSEDDANPQQESLVFHGDAEKLDCSKAVGHAQHLISSMLEGNEYNFQQGLFKQEEYEKNSRDLEKLRTSISVDDCVASIDQRKSFYLCLSNDSNHISACGMKYGYGI